MKYIVLPLVTLIVFSCGCPAQKYSKSWTDLNYGGDNKVYHNLDIFLPAEVRAMYPVVIVIYGSAFQSNNLKQVAYKTLGEPLLESGFAVITVNHRSSSDSLFPAQINDIKAAIRFVRAQGTIYQIDTTFIGVTGYSSGGHLAAFSGTSGSVNKFTAGSVTADLEGRVGKFTKYSSSVDAVVDWYGPTTFQIMDSCGSQMNHNAPDSPESLLIGGPIQENDDKCLLADPATYADKDDPPFLIFHGDADPLVPHCQSQRLFESLRRNNVPATFVLVQGAGHGPGLHIVKYFRLMTDFFRQEAARKNQ
jgi:acetyl esterase/lipase